VDEVVLAVDIGGTKMAVGLVDAHGAVRASDRTPTPVSADPEAVWSPLAALLAAARTGARESGWALRAVGVGCGGPMAGGGETVSPLNIAAWRGFPLRQRIEEATGVPVVVDNDAKALALGEGWVGAAAGCENFMAMVVSTGVGGGIVLDGRLLEGREGNAGHVGHLIVEPGGRLCACGARGCLEAEVSGTAIAAMTGAPAAAASEAVIERSGTLTGRAVADVANLLDLALVVIAGSVALGFGAPFFRAAQAEVVARARLAFAVGTRVRPAGLSASGPLVGAGALGWRTSGLPVLSVS
jgi:glucokinase